MIAWAHLQRLWTYLHEKVFLSRLSMFLEEDSQINFCREMSFGGLRGGALPCDVSPTPKNIDFFAVDNSLLARAWHIFTGATWIQRGPSLLTRVACQRSREDQNHIATRPILFEKINLQGYLGTNISQKGGRGSPKKEHFWGKINLWIFPDLKLFFGAKGYRKWSNEHPGHLLFCQYFSHHLLERELYYTMFRIRRIGLDIGFKIIKVPYLEF